VARSAITIVLPLGARLPPLIHYLSANIHPSDQIVLKRDWFQMDPAILSRIMCAQNGSKQFKTNASRNKSLIRFRTPSSPQAACSAVPQYVPPKSEVEPCRRLHAGDKHGTVYALRHRRLSRAVGSSPLTVSMISFDSYSTVVSYGEGVGYHTTAEHQNRKNTIKL
jgi:hypothetical protein